MKNMIVRCALLAAVAVAMSVPASGQEAAGARNNLKLTMQDGRVTLIAENVPLRQILQEWARVGQTTIVNADKLTGPPLTIQLVNAPERDVLDTLLRSAAGYIAAPRPAQVAGAAVYDRVTIMATSRAPAAVAASATPTFQRPPAPVDDGDEPINVTMPPVPPQQGQNPVTMQFPGMPPFTVPGNQQLPVTGNQPGPLTSPRPGALPTPAMPNIPNPYQPQVVRPGPGGPGGGPCGPGGGPGGQ